MAVLSAPPFCISCDPVSQHMIKLYIIDDYKDLYPSLRAGSLSDRIVGEILEKEGVPDPHILRTENGKPYERDGRAFFSVSHSGGFFACAVAGHEIGLDIEARTPKDPEAVARRFFTEDEVAFLDRISQPGEITDCSGDTARPGPGAYGAAFRRIWTRKEALIKFRGSILSEMLSSESVLEREDVDLIDLDLSGDIIGCICIPKGEERDMEILRDSEGKG